MVENDGWGAGGRTLLDDAVAAQERLARAVTLGTVEMAKVQTETALVLAQAMIGMGGHRHEVTPPIPGYDGLSMEEIEEKLHDLTAEETWRLRDYERSHRNRAVLLERFDRSLV